MLDVEQLARAQGRDLRIKTGPLPGLSLSSLAAPRTMEHLLPAALLTGFSSLLAIQLVLRLA